MGNKCGVGFTDALFLLLTLTLPYYLLNRFSFQKMSGPESPILDLENLDMLADLEEALAEGRPKQPDTTGSFADKEATMDESTQPNTPKPFTDKEIIIDESTPPDATKVFTIRKSSWMSSPNRIPAKKLAPHRPNPLAFVFHLVVQPYAGTSPNGIPTWPSPRTSASPWNALLEMRSAGTPSEQV